MRFKSESFKYDLPWRSNYEADSAAAWIFCAVMVILNMSVSSKPKILFECVFLHNLLFGCFMANRAWKIYLQHKRLKGVPLTFITVDELVQKLNDIAHEAEHWIGYGFVWEQRHAQAVFELLGRDYKSSIDDPNSEEKMGAGWIHGLELEEHELWQPLKHIEGHTLITGNPGSGKTRLLDLFINQCIQRGESVIIIDPKGDAGLRDNAHRACIAAEHEESFLFFHPAFPEKSIAIDPLKNYQRTTELASRISALMPSGGDSEPFTKFSWRVIDSICQAMLFCSIKPTLTRIYGYVESGLEDLLLETIRKHAEKQDSLEGGRNRYAEGLAYFQEVSQTTTSTTSNTNKVTNPMQQELIRNAIGFYRKTLRIYHPEPVIDELIEIFNHGREHYSKMISSLLPVLQMLTADSMKDLLSSDEKPHLRTVFDCAAFFNEQKVVFIGLDTLSDAEVGRMIGSLLLADLASAAGKRFNYEDPMEMKPINIFIDEASEVLNEPFIQLLNKGRGAAIRLFIATQSISDFAAGMRSRDKANQILGNINNKFALRTLDKATQDYLSDHMPTTKVKYVQRSQGVGGSASTPLVHSGHLDERLMEKEYPLCPPQLFSMIPNLEYIAFISGGTTIKGRIPIIVEQKAVVQRETSEFNAFSKYLVNYIDGAVTADWRQVKQCHPSIIQTKGDHKCAI